MPKQKLSSKNLLKKPDSKKYSLISVFDKTGIVDFAKTLVSLEYKIISTGGTARTLQEAGIAIIPIEQITGSPESFDGRMKTISFQIESGILYDRTNPSHIKQAKELKIPNISIVASNLYPFEKTVSKPEVKIDEAIESIDVGGPTMVRAAAKNFKSVLVLVDPKDYQEVSEKLKTKNVNQTLRQKLAAKVFQHLSFYDAQVARFLGSEEYPEEVVLPGRKGIKLRYGENPHQSSVVYFNPNTNSPLAHLQKITGRELSYVNFTDIAAGLESVRMFSDAAAVVIKHNSPSGIALGKDPAEALIRAIAADPESAFGGVVVLNKVIDLKTAKTFGGFKEENGVLIDIVAAPNVTTKAEEFIKTVRKTTGIYTFGTIPKKRSNTTHYKFFDGGFVTQEWDDATDATFKNWKVAGAVKPTKKQLKQMQIAWRFISRIKSNSIIVVDPNLPMTRGIGSGQTSRVRSTKIALEQAGKHTQGAILASDSFFPFNDSVKLAAKHGIAGIVQQGGSVRDADSIRAADKAGISMVFTGERKFWH